MDFRWHIKFKQLEMHLGLNFRQFLCTFFDFLIGPKWFSILLFSDRIFH
jgi:hypothetical protein